MQILWVNDIYIASYGSLAMIRDMKRIASFGDHTLVGAGGDMSDWQYIQHTLEAEMIKEYSNDDGHTFSPSHIHEYLARVATINR